MPLAARASPAGAPDRPPLAQGFLGALALTPRAERALLEYAWPGNVRELRNAMQRAAIVTRGAAVDVGALPPRIAGAGEG